MKVREYRCSNPSCPAGPWYLRLPDTDASWGRDFWRIEESRGEDMLFAQECPVCHNGDLVPGRIVEVPDIEE